MGLRFKFNIVLFLTCILGIATASAISYFIVQKSAVQEIHHSINLVRANAIAVRGYTVSHITPTLTEDNDILFYPETVASFSAQSVFARFKAMFPEFSYKEAALNPTNPDDLPNELEAELIKRLREDPSLDQISQVVETGDGRFLTVAFPLTINQQGCLICHSTPEAAPPAMVDLYGEENGFGWELGETVGAQIISAPMSIADRRAEETGIILIGGFTLLFVLIFLITNVMLGGIVLRPVRRMSEVAEKVSLGDFSIPEYRKKGKDEISSLSLSFNRVRRSLERAMSMIDD
ncbi:c-type heme family protein [Roseibium sp.]|uniref:Tll0287-like domain-containing protein n=1 Tax=Roseibium sp. TaxID=1936156 RepID=UPI003A96D593